MKAIVDIDHKTEVATPSTQMSNLYQIKIAEIWNYLKREDALFLLICLYLFFEYVRPQTLYPALDVIPYTQIILLLTLAIALKKGILFATKNAVNHLLTAFFLIIVISSVFAFDPGHAFSMIPDFVTWVIIYFLIINIVNTENRFLIFMLSFLLYSFKMSQHSFRGWAGQGFGFSNWGTGGGPGWFHNSGEFGIQMCVFLPLAACFFWSLKEHWPLWKKILFALLPITAVTGMVSSSSRGALLGGIAVMLFFLLKSKYKIKGTIALVLILGAVYLAIPEEQKMRFQQAGDDQTSMNRIERWEKGLEMAKRYPLLGVGYRNWEMADNRLFLGSGAYCHNIFIECMSELGYSGLIAFILMIIYTFINNRRTRKIAKEHLGGNKFIWYMAHGLDGALVGYLVSGFFVTVLYYPYFWVNLAMTVALNNVAKNEVS